MCKIRNQLQVVLYLNLGNLDNCTQKFKFQQNNLNGTMNPSTINTKTKFKGRFFFFRILCSECIYAILPVFNQITFTRLAHAHARLALSNSILGMPIIFVPFF